MKKLLTIFILAGTVLAGCNGATDPDVCYEAVQKTFPQGKVLHLTASKYRFIVVQDSTIFYVETMGMASPSPTLVKMAYK